MKFDAFDRAITTSSVTSTQAQEPTDVTLVQLIANPEKFDGRMIKVIGFFRFAFEGTVLYLHRQDYENAILGNGIWVDVTPGMVKQCVTTLHMNYAIFEGVFSARQRGHMNIWSGTIKQVRRAELWQSAKK